MGQYYQTQIFKGYGLRCLDVSGPHRNFSGSSIWHNFNKIRHCFLQNFCWAFGSGHRIFIGEDNILGIRCDFTLTNDLVQCIHSSGIFYQNQAISTWTGHYPIWKRSDEMGLEDLLAGEWERMRIELRWPGIRREASGDRITWQGKMKVGCMVVTDIYNTFCLHGTHKNELCDFYKFWKTKIPIKIILFVWLVWKSKNLTWENLHKRNW